MWNDEDNNPYGSFDARSDDFARTISPPHLDSDSDRAGHGLDPMNPNYLASPTSKQRRSDLSDDEDEDEDGAQRRRRSGGDEDDDDDEDDGEGGEMQARRKKGGYDSRLEQLLYEQPDVPIVIIDAGKSVESGGSYIVYTIRTGDFEVRRRYSEFSSLRATLVSLHPTLIIPPIPEKHSMADYAARPTRAKEDQGIIELRKRMLGVFLNRCREMRDVREDGVWWRFLDPNVSWNEILHSTPVASIPKSNMKAPPLNPSNPTPAHQYLPVPSSNAKLRSNSVTSNTSSTGTPTSPPERMTSPSAAAHTTPGPQIFARFPPTSQTLSEPELDPYFASFESSTRELEQLLQGQIDRANRRALSHLASLAADLCELGARYNGFSLSEPSATLAAAIERVGQAADAAYLSTEELASSLGASFAEPMRESAQFAGVVRAVLRFRILKRVQQEMTRDELARKRALLDQLERSEMEAKRIEQYLTTSASTGNIKRQPGAGGGGAGAGAGGATGRARSPSEGAISAAREEDAESFDSDFPPTHAEYGSGGGGGGGPRRSKSQSAGRSGGGSGGGSSGGGYGGIFGRVSHAVRGMVDVDSEKTRRDQIGKTKESLVQLEQALEVSEQDVKDASAGVLKDLKRFQGQKEEDLRRYMIAFAKCHIDWAKKNLEQWREAEEEVKKIEVR